MKKLLTYALLLTMVTLAQCKKPDGTTPKSNPSPGPSLTDDQRLAVLDAVEKKFAELSQANLGTAPGQLLPFLQSQSAFEASGIADSSNCAWARFTDGRLLIVANNRESSDFDNRGGRISFEPDGRGARTEELPSDQKVILANAMGTRFINSTAGIKSIFAGKGYQVSDGDASVEGLKKVNTEDHAIFYLNAHGGEGELRDTFLIINGKVVHDRAYGIWTTDTTSATNETKFADDLNKGYLCYFIASKDEPTKGSITYENHYAITDKFVKHYMKFGKNSLVFLDACGSYNADMETAFQQQAKDHEIVYVGWDHNAKDDIAYRTTKFLFDRLLGTNATIANPNLSVPKEDPPQRPFDVDAVIQDLKDRKVDFYTYTDQKTNAAVTSRLQYFSTAGLGIDEDGKFSLAPSIAYLDIDENFSTLTIHGIFGKDPGTSKRKITVDGVAVTADTWYPNLITCSIPKKGTGSVGDVLVSVLDHPSNAVPLTEWNIPLSYATDWAGLRQEVTFHLRLRADVHPYRRKPHEAAKPIKDSLLLPFPGHPFAEGSQAAYTIGGQAAVSSCSIPACQVLSDQATLSSGAGSIPYRLAPEQAKPYFTAAYQWDKDRKKLQVMLIAAVPKAAQLQTHARVKCGDDGLVLDVYYPPKDAPAGSADTPLSVGVPFDGQLLEFELSNSNYNIEKGLLEGKRASEYRFYCQPPYSEAINTKILVQWQLSQPKFAPTDQTPARMGLLDE